MGTLILILFCLILYRTCRHYKARKASSAAKRPASSPSGVSTPSLSRKPSHKRCPRPPTIHRPHLNGIQKQKVNTAFKVQWRISFTTRRGPRPNTGRPCEPPAPLESHHRRSPHHPVSRELKTNQPTLHTPSRSKLIVISKLIVKCKISFYLLTLKPTYYYCIAHFSFQYYTLGYP